MSYFDLLGTRRFSLVLQISKKIFFSQQFYENSLFSCYIRVKTDRNCNMTTFLVCLALLIAAYFTYGRYLERLVDIEPAAEIP